MGRKKKEVVVEPKGNKSEVTKTEAKEDLRAIAGKRQRLIDVIIPKLLTNAQLRRGGSSVRSAYERERGYERCLEEINELGKKLSLRPIGLGHLRK